MADKRISQLNSHTTPSGSDLLVIVNNNETKKITYADLKDSIVINSDNALLNQFSASYIIDSASFDTRITAATNEQSFNGLISSSAQITSFGFVSGSYETTGRGILSGSISYNDLTNIPSNIVSESVDISSLNSFTQSYFTDSASIDSRVLTEKGRIDAILSASTADADTFAEIVTLINSVDLTNDTAFASYYTSSNARINSLENATSSYETIGRGIVSGSSQLTASYDERYSLSGSVFTPFSQSVDTRLDNLETLNHTYSGSLSGSFTGSAYVDYIVFNSSSAAPLVNYMFQANTTDKTLDLRMGNNATLQLGQEMYYPPIVNKSGVDLNDGDLVMVNPAGVAQGNRISVVKCVSDGTYPADYIVGVLTEDIANNQEGFATWFGYVRNVSLTHLQPAGETWVEGDILYPNPTIPGKMTNVLPTAPALKSTIAVITSINGNNVTLLVRPALRGMLDTLHNINIVSGSTGDILMKSGSIWYNNNTFSASVASLNTSYNTTSASFDSRISTLVSSGVPAGTVSGSSQLTGSFDTRYTLSGSVQPLPSGVISGSSQLTSSFDARYSLSGSSTNINTGSFTTTGSNTFIGTETISGSLLLSGSFSYNGTPLQNGFAFAQPKLTRILDNVSYTGASAWTTSYTGSGGAIIVTVNVSGYRTTGGLGTAQLLRDGVAVASQTFYFNIANYHTPLPPIVYASNSETGSHTYSIYFSNIIADGNDYATINVLEYGNSAILPATLISGSSQLTSSFDTRYEGVGRGIVSGSSQLTSSYDTRYVLSGSVTPLSNGIISGSDQLTSSFDTRYLNTNGDGVISGSSQLTSSYDGRYTLTSSFNSFTASAQAVTTGSNSFNGTQTITGSLIITTGSFFASQITANTASLYLTSGSNIYVQNNGVVEITGSLIVSGSANFNVNVLSVDGRSGDEGGEINLAIPVTNTTLQNRVTIDVWQNRYRVFEGSANAKGVFVDLSKAPAGVGGELMWKASGLVNLGVDVTLGDLKARLPSTGNKSLQLSTTSAGVTYSVYGSGIYSQAGTVVGTTINASSPLSITSTPTYLASGYNFGTAGATDTWIIMDTSNTISWRITMILGSGFNNNMISIERLV